MKLNDMLCLTDSLQIILIIDHSDNCKIHFGKVRDFYTGGTENTLLDKMIIGIKAERNYLKISVN